MINIVSANKLKDIFASSNKIAIFGHDYVDWDCVGAMLWLWKLLENFGKKITYHTSFASPKYLHFLSDISKITTEFDYDDYDLILVLDMNDITRISKFDISKQQNICIIDHHPFSQNIPYPNIIDTSYSSVCELIRDYIYYLYPDQITSDISTYLLLWTITDSGRFLYEKDSVATFAITSQMLSKWAQKYFILDNIKPTYDQSYIDLLIIFLQRVVLLDNIVYSYLLYSDLLHFWEAKIDDYEGFREFIVNYSWSEVSIYISQKKDDELKFSLRSRNQKAWLMARNFGGGWHDNAWSFTIKIDLSENIYDKISQTIYDINIFYQKLFE